MVSPLTERIDQRNQPQQPHVGVQQRRQEGRATDEALDDDAEAVAAVHVADLRLEEAICIGKYTLRLQREDYNLALANLKAIQAAVLLMADRLAFVGHNRQ